MTYIKSVVFLFMMCLICPVVHPSFMSRYHHALKKVPVVAHPVSVHEYRLVHRLPPSVRMWKKGIMRAARITSLPVSLIAAVMVVESHGHPWVVSVRGAQGLMQVEPKTAGYIGIRKWWIPDNNILTGSIYLKKLLQHYRGKVILALAAYNAGPSVVDHYNGIPPFPETAAYVRKVNEVRKNILSGEYDG